MLREFFVRPGTGRVDRLLIALTLVSAFSFAGAMILGMYPIAK
jgi:hypothetical protein